MTHRAIWGYPFPDHADFPTAEEAHAFALGKSREAGEVAVIELDSTEDSK